MSNTIHILITRIIKAKVILLILSIILFILSGIGLIKAYSVPAETIVEEQVTLVEYNHEGKFDYLVYLKPSYLYGPEPEEPVLPPSEMKYPAEYIDRFNMTFDFSFVPDKQVTQISENVEVKAIVKRMGVDDEEIILVPETEKTGNFTTSFILYNIEDLLSGNIEIIATVYATIKTDTGMIFEDFTQNMSVKPSGSLVVVSGDLEEIESGYFGELNYEQRGHFDYDVLLHPSSPYGSIILSPPEIKPTEPLPRATMGTGDIILSDLVDEMEVIFSYTLNANKPIADQYESVTVEAIIENPGKWAKTITLVPLTRQDGDFNITFPLDLKQYIEIFGVIQQETGVPISARNLTIKVNVDTTAVAGTQTIESEFTQSITTDLREGIVVWSGDIEKSEPGTIDITENIIHQEKFIGIEIKQLRIISPIVTSIVFLLLLFSIMLYFWKSPLELSEIEKEVQQVAKKYKGIIIEIEDLPVVKPGETVVWLRSLEDLVKAAEGLLKPILHKAGYENHIYCVLDPPMRYECRLGEDYI